MRTKTPELIAPLTGIQFLKRNLFALPLIGARVSHWTDAATDVTAGLAPPFF